MNVNISNDAKSKKWQVSTQLNTVLITCGILSSLIYVITDIISSVVWRDYSYTESQLLQVVKLELSFN